MAHVPLNFLASAWPVYGKSHICLQSSSHLPCGNEPVYKNSAIFEQRFLLKQGAKKVSFTVCHSGSLLLTCISPKVISMSPKNVLMRRIDYTVLLSFEFLKNFSCPLGKLRTKFTSPIEKSTGYRTVLSLHAVKQNQHLHACPFSTNPFN